MRQGVAPSTQKTYNSAERLFVDFCQRSDRTPLPASESTLILFVAELAQTRAHSTIRVYLAGVRHLHILNGWANPLENTPRLSLVVKGVRRVKPKRADPRLPITPAILVRIHQGLQQGPMAEFDKVMLWAACTLAFFGFLRCSEFTQASASSYDSSRHLSNGDVAVDSREAPTRIAVKIRSSKTDQFCQGATIIIGKGNTTLCPVAAMLQYLSIRPKSTGPLFINHTGKHLTKQIFIEGVKQAMATAKVPSQGYKGHSFRIGAATTAAAAGVSETLIKTMGRWSSAAYQIYIRTPPSQLARVASQLVTHRDI